MSDATDSKATITLSADGVQLSCTGAWVVSEVSRITAELKSVSKDLQAISQIDLAGITHMDSAGALMLSDMLDRLSQDGQIANAQGLKAKFQALFALVSDETQKLRGELTPPNAWPNGFYVVGRWAANKYFQFLSFLAFIGELMVLLFHALTKPNRVQWKAILKVMDESGYRALPIVALMALLIGVVLSYQLAAQLKVYGADIFVVDVSGVAILREFAPLITAIIMAGRTSTSFAALIGTMKVNEEIDALKTIGVFPIGSMLMTKAYVAIPYYAFLERFQYAVSLKQFILGMIKTPVFAIIIATVGCFQGFQTGTSAESVGQRTTAAAVQAIFLIIIADAAFSILYSMMGL